MALEAKIYKREKYWVFHIEDWDEDLDAPTNENWTESIEWTAEQLDGSLKANRMSYDMWYFKRKIDAEKFRTLWILKWLT